MVKIIIDNIYSKIVGFLPEKVQSDLDKTLSYKILNAQFMPMVKNNRWNGVIHLYQKSKGQYFYTGLLALVREVLKENDIKFERIDQRIIPEKNLLDLEFIPSDQYTTREYQDFTIDRAIKFTRGILSVATGGGKTLIVTRLISEIKTVPFIFYVLTKDLMEQAHGVLSSSLNVPIGRIGDGEVDIKDITVCTIQTAIRALNAENKNFKISDYQFDDEDVWNEQSIKNQEKIDSIKNLIVSAKGIYLDETHHAAAKTVKDVLVASKNAYWRYGGSATPYRESGDEIMIQAMFGAKIVDISASYLIKNKHLIKPYIFFIPIDSSNDFHSYQKVYESSILKNDKLNRSVASIANKLVSDGLSVLILVQQYPQGDFIKTLIPNCEFVTGKMSLEKRTECLKELKDGKVKCLIATSLADEGLDVPTLDAVILAGGGKSSVRLHQRIGRTIRKDKDGRKDKSIVIVYDHYNTRFLKKHTKRIKTLLKKEEEFVIVNSNGTDFINDEINSVFGRNTASTVFD